MMAMLFKMNTLNGPMVNRSLVLRVLRCRPGGRCWRLREGGIVMVRLLSVLDSDEAQMERSVVKKMGRYKRLGKCVVCV